MKIAVFGTGGVGGYFGGLLAIAGHEVTFIARGEHLQAIREKGLAVHSINGDFHISPAQATGNPKEVGVADYVIISVKHYHLAEAVSQVHPLVGPQTTVVPLLNGVGAHEILAAELGPENVVGGLCSLVTMIKAPGVIRQPSKLRRVVVGELDHRKSTRVDKLVRAWADCGAEAIHAEDIHAAMWTKFVFIASFGGVTSLARGNAGEVRTIPETRALFVEAMREIEALARARGVNLSPDVVENSLALTDNFEPEATSSMQRDVEDGNMFELEAFSGTVVRLGEEWGVPTPVHRMIYGLLRPTLLRARG
jgi:2-dehydropantoate 2-reductase